MITIEEQRARIDNMIQSLESDMPLELLRIAEHDLRVLVMKRVTEDGLNYKGEPFSAYSNTPTYIDTIKNSPRKLPPKGKTGRSVFKSTGKPHKTTYFGDGYKEFRERIGRDGTKKNFELTTEMWRNFNVVGITTTGEIVTVSLAGLDKETQAKLDGNSKREGYSIIEASEEEREMVEGILQKWLEDLAINTFES